MLIKEPPRYVDISDLKWRIKEQADDCRHNENIRDADTYDGVIEDIDATETADVAPVRHGYWEPIWFDNDDKEIGADPSDFKCSVCANIIPNKRMWDNNYCKFCGALMDKE